MHIYQSTKIVLIFVFSLLQSISFTQSLKPPYLGTRTIQIVKQHGFEFKDLNKNGALDKYEDWRLPSKIRAQDLVSKMNLEEKIG
ncbi:MAG: hypothetical protein KA143_05095, partial [Saprospiraceae bacterium]|nr:hypothetical protein [Saprospiraceae bacterium]